VSRIRLTHASIFAVLISFGIAGIAMANSQKPPAAAKQGEKKDEAHAHSGEPSNFTLLEVMQHLAASEQQIQTGLLMNNRLMVKKGAMAIAHHPMPKGGIKPYIKKNHDELKGTIKTMDSLVHDSAVELVKQADTASMLELNELNAKMVKGCISCHNVFRD